MGPRKRSKPNPEAEEERDLKPESGVRATSQPSVTTSSNLSAKPEEDADHRRDITVGISMDFWYESSRTESENPSRRHLRLGMEEAHGDQEARLRR